MTTPTKYKIGDILTIVSNKHHYNYELGSVGMDFVVNRIDKPSSFNGKGTEYIYRDNRGRGCYEGDCALAIIKDWKSKINGGI